MKKAFIVLIPVVLIGALLYTAIRYNSFQHFDLKYYVCALVLYAATVCLRSFKVMKITLLQSQTDDIVYREALPLTASGQLVGAFIPGRAGEILLSAYMRMKYRMDITRTLPTFFIDKLSELLFVCFYFVGVVLLFEVETRDYFYSYFISLFTSKLMYGLLVILVVLAIVVIYLSRTRMLNILLNIKQGLLLPIYHPMLGLQLVCVSAMTMFTEFLYLYTIFHSLGVSIPLSKIIIVHALGMIIGVISMIPGGQGSTEVSMIAVLHLWGYSSIQVLAPILFSKTTTYILLLLFSIPMIPFILRLFRRQKSGEYLK